MGLRRKLMRYRAKKAGAAPQTQATPAPGAPRPNPDEQVWPFGLYSQPDTDKNGEPYEQISVLGFPACRRRDITELSHYLFTTDLETLKVPVPYKLLVAYSRPVRGEDIIASIRLGQGVEGVRGCAEIRVPTGSDLLRGASAATMQITKTAPGDA